jgi:ATP-dependent helicase/nuclease subunit A
LKEGGFLWKSADAIAPEIQIKAKQAAKEFADQERMRLLYVALTRAEQWLVVAGAGDAGGAGKSWYNLVSEAMANKDWLPVEQTNMPQVGPCLSLLHLWSEISIKIPDVIHTAQTILPIWAQRPAPETVKKPALLSPSNLPGAKFIAGSEGSSAEDALRKGRQVHVLLEHFDGIATSDRASRAEQLLIGDCLPKEIGELEAILAEVGAVLDDPALRHIFATDALAEVGISAEIPELGGQRIDGIIDRLIITDERVLAIDLKTNSTVPKRAEEIPDGILRQLGAYRSALMQVYPNHNIEVAVLWTATRQIMTVPHDIVMVALQSTRGIA